MEIREAGENSAVVLHVSPTDAEKRLDAYLAEKIENWSRSRLQKLIDEGDCLVNQKESKSSYKLRSGDEIEIELTELPTAEFVPEDIPLEIVYEDAHLAVVNKPAGMVVHPGAGVPSGTLANAVAYKFNIQSEELKFAAGSDEQSKIQNLKSKIGIVHRLDKNTSGLIVVAKDEATHEALSEQFRARAVYKSYVALVHGATRENSGRIEATIGRDRYNRLKMSANKAGGRSALSLWKVRQRFEKFTLLDVQIKTGRTHQIRVHLAFINHPVVGDETYNEGRDKTVADPKIKQAIINLSRVFLHAEKLAFTHPHTQQRLNFVAALPAELTEFLKLFNLNE
ncbi:MAG TPA: RluA family pseudouridine synthase [Pyrinomonadaceae bacterium]|jgi:23S rRNA pseudouridine1911/1915/1917 synthase